MVVIRPLMRVEFGKVVKLDVAMSMRDEAGNEEGRPSRQPANERRL